MSVKLLIIMYNKIGKFGVFFFLIINLFFVLSKRKYLQYGWKKTDSYKKCSKISYEKHRSLFIKDFKGDKKSDNIKDLEKKHNTIYPMS